LVTDFHVADDLVITVHDAVIPLRKGDRWNGVAAFAFASNAPYVCHDAATDPHYAPYYFEVVSVAAVPIPWQGRPIGVLSVSSRRKHAVPDETLPELSEIAAKAAKFLRRAQLYRQHSKGSRRPFLIKGLSPEWLEVERRIERVAPTDAPVLISGESGTG